MKLEIEVDVRDDMIDKKQLEEYLRKEAILTLFAERKIPAGHAARALGLTRRQFVELLQQRGIPIVDYTLSDFEQDLNTIEELWPEIEKNVRESGAGRIE